MITLCLPEKDNRWEILLDGHYIGYITENAITKAGEVTITEDITSKPLAIFSRILTAWDERRNY
jgi:hypothetical protein